MEEMKEGKRTGEKGDKGKKKKQWNGDISSKLPTHPSLMLEGKESEDFPTSVFLALL